MERGERTVAALALVRKAVAPAAVERMVAAAAAAERTVAAAEHTVAAPVESMALAALVQGTVAPLAHIAVGTRAASQMC